MSFLAVDENICSCRARPRSCMRISTRSSHRSSSGTIRAYAGDPSSSAAGSCSPRATRRRPSGSARRWAASRRAGCARTRCRVEPRMSAYSEASKAVFAVFEDTTPLVEGMSIDEAFLDVRGLRRLAGTPTEIAARLRQRVLERSACVSRSAWPDEVPREGRERRRQARRPARRSARRRAGVPPSAPVERLWGVGRVTAEKLHLRGIETVGQVARARRAGARRDARPRVGPASARPGAQPRSPARAGGRRRRRSAHSARSVAARRSREEIDAIVVAIVDRLARRLRGGTASVSHGRPPPALRRLHARDAIAHAATGDDADPGDPRHGTRAARGGRRR